jgi:hypothetical protein
MRDRHDTPWAAAMTLGGKEYEAECAIRRLGVSVYLPQMRKSWLPHGATKPMLRAQPLFPRYLFLPLPEARARQLHYVRGLAGHQYLLASVEGKIWQAPAQVIFDLAKAENEGKFDEIPPDPGDRVRLRAGGALSALDLFVSSLGERTAQLFSPLLLGGARVTARVSDLTRAA